ncbi:MAG: LLM class flavin-dependent oxidoreductase, partial [Thermomicrobium sp.]|nr:LLM class flavin-dependent oxidoreductase [Thermomicrobium sp.]
AVRTERIRLGTGVTSPLLRQPVQIALAIATLDRLSDGRAFVGLGRGQPEFYANGLGMEVQEPLTTVAETIALLRQWWRPPYRASLEGRRFRVRDWPLSVPPVQVQVPIYLAALGRRARDLAARLADGILIADFASESFLATVLPELRAAIVAAGRDPGAFSVFLRGNLVVTEDPEPVLEERKVPFALLCTLPGMAQQVVVPGFDTARLIAELRRVVRTEELLRAGRPWHDVRAAVDPAAIKRIVPTELMAQLCLVGPVTALRRRLARLAELGVTHVVARALPTPDPDAYRQLVEDLRTGKGQPLE